jgi:thioredoxin 1
MKDSALGRSLFMKTSKKNILLAIGIIVGFAVVLINSHVKYSAFVEEFDYAAAKARGLPILVEFGSQACPPCKQMVPVLRSLNESHRQVFAIGYIDVLKDKAAVGQYNIEVTPTQIFYDKDGKELYRHQGPLSAESILAKWNELGIVSTISN